MTKEITKAYILQQIQDKLGLRELEPETFSFEEHVIPTYNIEKHVHEFIAEYNEESVTSGPSNVLMFTVPEDEQWELLRYTVVFMAAGAYKVTGVMFYRPAQADMYIDMKEGQTAAYHVEMVKSAILTPNTLIRIHIDDYTSTAGIRLYIDYIKEKLR